MDLNRLKTPTEEARAIISSVQNYRDVWRQHCHNLSPLTEVSSGPKNKKLIRNDKLEKSAFLGLLK
jgi:hypothetical protein